MSVDLDAVPAGKVRTVDGKIIDREKAVYVPKGLNTVEFHTMDGRKYLRDASGSIRVFGMTKQTKAEKKAYKRSRRSA